MKMTLRKLSTGNYFGHYMTHYIFAFKRPHGKWCCMIGKGGEWLYREGYHGASLPTVNRFKKWAKDKIRKHLQINGEASFYS